MKKENMKNSRITISKSDYMLFLRHPAWLWLKKFDKNKLPPINENTQALFITGHKFEGYVEKLYPDAVMVGFDIGDFETYTSMPFKTKEILDEGVSAIFQGRFEIDDLTCIVDVLDRIEGNIFDLIEIKSSTKAKLEHEYDLAFQTAVLEKSEISIRNIYVIHANNEYVRNGEIEPEAITTKTDVTQNVRNLIEITNDQIKKAFEVLSQKTIPDLSPRYVNQLGIPGTTWFSDWLEVYTYLNPNLDPYSIYSLAYPNAKQIGELENIGVNLINDVPEELALRAKQLAQIKTTKSNERILYKGKIKKFLDTFEYPLYFLDYETLSSVIPVFDGFQPYVDYPFQYSLHIQDSPDSEIRHEEYLHQENSNPMPDLLKKLKSDIGNKGTILAWNMSYEKGCNDRMASFYPEYKEFLEDINKRIKDLMVPFSEMWFVDKDFFGSASIKKVLPVLVPELSYKEMGVSDGLKARRMWTETILEGKHQDQREKIIENLSKYCTLDTFAMVEIHNRLKDIKYEN